MQSRKDIEKILKENNLGIRLDIGCGDKKQKGFTGLDYRALPGVDIVHDITKFPWPLPDECCSFAMCSHVLEHISPDPIPIQLNNLITLLIDKGVITKCDVEDYIGDYSLMPRFMRVMDEIWRILKYDGQLALSVPYGGSSRFIQDPTHVNNINEITIAYFDPLEPRSKGELYRIYRPKPWRINYSVFQMDGSLEALLSKRKEDESYYVDVQQKLDESFLR